MQEVLFGQLLDIGWVTLDHTNLLPNHHLIITHTSEQAHSTQWMVLATKKIGSPDNISSYGYAKSKMQRKNDNAIYLWYLQTAKFMDIDALKHANNLNLVGKWVG